MVLLGLKQTVGTLLGNPILIKTKFGTTALTQQYKQQSKQVYYFKEKQCWFSEFLKFYKYCSNQSNTCANNDVTIKVTIRIFKILYCSNQSNTCAKNDVTIKLTTRIFKIL